MNELTLHTITELITNFFNFVSETVSLTIAQDRNLVYNQFLDSEAGFNSYKLAFLDKGIKNSPYHSQVENYPDYLTEQPSLAIGGVPSYPQVGELPAIDEQALEFLHPDIKQACICIGGAEGGPFKARWLGREARVRGEFWSTTKIIPILNVICSLKTDINACAVRGDGKSFGIPELIEDIVTYDSKIGSSNSIAAMFKRFQTFADLEAWLKGITGTPHTIFRGMYGEDPFIANPEVIKSDEVLLTAAPETEKTENSVTAYDLTRIISMVGWHYHLPSTAQLPGSSWDNLKPFILALGKDPGRYLDVAIEKLGIQNRISKPVILSKMGFGYSSWQQRTELTYTCFTQFDYQDKLISVAMTLRCAKALGDFDCAARTLRDREAVEVDARMAAEVTEILRRLVTGELQ